MRYSVTKEEKIWKDHNRNFPVGIHHSQDQPITPDGLGLSEIKKYIFQLKHQNI